MKVLVVGGGGREHAIIKKLRENKDIETIYALPGNGGIAKDAICTGISATDLPGIVHFAVANAIDYAIVTPDDPLAMGCVDKLNEKGIPCFGPTAAAAKIESSKAFSKRLMEKYHIPTAKCSIFSDMDEALKYVSTCPLPTVVKADGLALGKGVIIAKTREEAASAVKGMMDGKMFGESGTTVVIEEFLEGPEITVLAFTDGTTIVPMISSMDHKRAHDNDEGLNAGGMGSIAPNPYYTKEVADACMEKIFLPTVKAMKTEGREFRGCLYFGLMLTKDGPKVIEYNSRFGDPETQVVLPLLQSDLYTVMRAVTDGTLDKAEVKFAENKNCCCVVIASKGYPEHYEKGFPITLPEERKDEYIYVAGAKTTEDGSLLSSGGRVLGLSAVADTLECAIYKAYALADRVEFANGFMRRDIGARALNAQERR